MFISRSKLRTLPYRKIWLGRGWHFIFDPRNKWVVFGKRSKTSGKYQYRRFLWFAYIAACARVDRPGYERQLRLMWGHRAK